MEKIKKIWHDPLREIEISKIKCFKGGIQIKTNKVNMKFKLPQLSKTFPWEYFWFGLS